MKLRFYARSGSLVPDPRQRRTQGEGAMFVGRLLVPPPPGSVGVAAEQVTTKEPTEIDTDYLAPEQLAGLRRDAGRDKALWCADEATAAFLGIPFVAVTYDEKLKRFDPAPVATQPALTPEPTPTPEPESNKAKKSGKTPGGDA